MRLIFIYGPAAVGKQTVGEELVKQKGYKLLHLHQVFNLLSGIFGIESDIRWKLGREIRLRIFEEAAKADINMITTFGGGKEEFDFFDDVVSVVEENGGQVCFVHLTADLETIFKRAEGMSRKTHLKMTSAEELQRHFSRFPGVFEKYTKREHLSIDNTQEEPDETAKKIITYFAL